MTYSKASKAYNPAIEVDDDSHSKYMSDSKRYQAYERDIEDSEVSFYSWFNGLWSFINSYLKHVLIHGAYYLQ